MFNTIKNNTQQTQQPQDHWKIKRKVGTEDKEGTADDTTEFTNHFYFPWGLDSNSVKFVWRWNEKKVETQTVCVDADQSPLSKV